MSARQEIVGVTVIFEARLGDWSIGGACADVGTASGGLLVW